MKTIRKAPELVMSVLQIGKCDSDLQAQRLEVCAACPSDLAKPCWPGAKKHCCGGMMKAVTAGTACGCVLKRLASRRRNLCPKGHWEA